jgi:hypothetical protein
LPRRAASRYRRRYAAAAFDAAARLLSLRFRCPSPMPIYTPHILPPLFYFMIAALFR